MPLSRSVPRKLIHTRNIKCDGYHREDGLWDIEASLVDTKTYSFGNVDRGGINSGDPIHGMLFRLTLDDDMVVRDAEAAIDAGPFSICNNISSVFKSLIGLRISPGWRKAIRSRVSGTRGCTHLTELLTGPITATANLTVRDTSARHKTPPAPGKKPNQLDSCHALASESQVVKREWPEFYKGD